MTERDLLTNQEKQKLKEKLLGFAGFKIREDAPILRYSGDKLWQYPDKDKYGNNHYEENPPDLLNSLDACFKWLVPKLKEIDHLQLEEIEFSYAGEITFCNLLYSSTKYSKAFPTAECFSGQSKTEALALCLAIEKLIDSGVKK